jgi:hypothetical protein
VKLIGAACVHCGSWKNAIEMAGFDYVKVRVRPPPPSREQILAALRKGAKSKRTGIGDDGFVTAPVACAARRAFGSLRKALLAADLDPERLLRRSVRSERELAALLRELAEKHPTMTLTELRYNKLGASITRHYGTLSKGLKQLGIDDDWPIRRPPPPSREQILAALRKGAKSKRTGIGDDGFVTRRVASAAQRAFGSLRKALLAADLDPERLLRKSVRSTRELAALVRELAKKHPTMTLSQLYPNKLAATIVSRYGTLSKGLKQLGIDDWPIRVLSKKEVIVQLRQRHRRGAAMTFAAVTREDIRLRHGVLKHFGTWRKAMQAIGLDAPVSRPSRRTTSTNSPDA